MSGLFTTALVVTLLSFAAPAAPPSPVASLADWFRQYRSRAPELALWSDESLQEARLGCGRDVERLADFERFEDALREHLGGDEATAHRSTPATLIAAIRVNRAFDGFRGRGRFEEYADLLERLDLVASDGSEAAISLLLEVASVDAGRSYNPREWRLREPFRPHLVRREARLALLRVPFSRSLETLLAALRDDESAPERRAVVAELVATLVRRDSVSAFHRFRLRETGYSLLSHDGPTGVRVAAAGVVTAALEADREATLPDPKLERLLELVQPDAPDDLSLMILRIFRASPREVVLRGLAERLVRVRTWTARVEDGIRVTLDHLTPVRFTVVTRPEEILDWIERERGTVRFQDYLLERQRQWRDGARKDLEKKYADAPRFYGIPIVGRRVVFVIDGSGSMQEVLDPATMKTKIAGAREELSRAIAGLDAEVRFDIISFNDGVRQLDDSFVPATPANKRRAERFIQGTGSMGWTNLFDALTRAIGMTLVGGKIGGRPRPIPDQVVLLSDGRPTRGLMTNTFDIVEEVTRLNRSRELRLDAVAFGEEADTDFLGALAARNGGELAVFPPPSDDE